MFPEVLWVVPPAAAAVPVGAAVWRNWSPQSWNYGPGLVGNAARVHLTWSHVAEGCGLSRKRSRLMVVDGKPQRRQVAQAPKLRWFRPSAYGFRVRVRLHDGQTPADVSKVVDRLAHAWRVHAVRVRDWGPGWVELVATTRDPLVNLKATQGDESAGLLRVHLGRLETGEPWVVDFRQVPHWLVIGATQSGKSTDVNAMIRALAPQPVALAGLDLKGGVELTPYESRLSRLATTREECSTLLDDLLGLLADRMALCREHRVRNVWRLPEEVREARAVPVVVFVDEVAELYLMADKYQKNTVARTSTALLRIAQLGRAFAVHLVVCGQRVGSDLGPGVTALRSQLSGRICHRVNDQETAKMALGDLAPESLEAALSIPAEMPGVAVTVGADGRWHRARSFLTTEEEAEQAAEEFAHLAPSWETLTAAAAPVVDLRDAAEFAEVA